MADNKINRRRKYKSYPARNLSYITSQGGRKRRERYVREISTYILPVVFAIVAQTLFYSILTTYARNHEWQHISLTILVLASVPILSAMILAAFRWHDSPIVVSSAITVAAFAMAVSVLAAMRIDVSYNGILGSLIIILPVMAYANIRFNLALSANVAIAPFDKLQRILGEFDGVRVLEGPDADLSGVEILLIDPAEHHSEKWSRLLADCYLSGIEIMPWSRFLEVRRGRVDITSFDISHLAYSPSQLLYARVKRGLDILAVFLSLPIVLPIALAVAVYIFVRDGRPVIFVQLRRGYGGRRFRMYKFRTMYRKTEGGATMHGDNRIIPGARHIRKFRFDELPQLYNILRGDMTLIGPRPVAVYIAKASTTKEPKYNFRSLIQPGITGWAQVTSGYAATVDEEIEKLSYDLYYIKHMSLDLDLLILFMSIKTVLLGSGAR